MRLSQLGEGLLLRILGRAYLAFCVMLFATSLSGEGIDWGLLRAASKRPVEQLEQVYLHELSAAVLSAIHRYAQVSGVSAPHSLDSLERFKQCRHLLPTLQDREQQLRHASAVPDDAYFEHLLILSLTVVQLNHRLHELGVEKAALQKNFMEDVIHHDDSRAKLATLDEKISTLHTHVDTIFSSDTANMLLTIPVTDPANAKKELPFFQKIVLDYQQLLADGVIGTEIISALRAKNKALLQQVVAAQLLRSEKLLQQAWQHTCAERTFALLRPKSESLLFYLKHRALTQHVETLLDDASRAELKALHDKLRTAAADKLKPAHFSTSPRSFFGLLGALVVPSFFVAHKHNKFTLPLMAATGLSVTWSKTRTLQRMRQQLHGGVCNGLNSYADYLVFKNGTSLSRYAFSHLAATGLAIVLRKIPKPKSVDKKFMNVDAKFLAVANAFGSFVSMLAIETMQTKNLNFLKDRESFYNIFALLTVDFALAYISALNISDEMRIALISSSTLLLSVVGHVVSGKEINWDRIVYDTTFISTYSLYKSVYFYTSGSRALIKNFNISSKTGQTALMSGMALLSNILGNIPYALISRHWIEKKPPPNMFPAQDNTQPLEDIEQIVNLLRLKHQNN